MKARILTPNLLLSECVLAITVPDVVVGIKFVFILYKT